MQKMSSDPLLTKLSLSDTDKPKTHIRPDSLQVNNKNMLQTPKIKESCTRIY